MPTSRTITKEEFLTHLGGEIRIKAWSGNAHSADILIQKNTTTITNGNDELECTEEFNEDDFIYVEGCIYRPQDSSSNVNFSIDLEGPQESKTFNYHVTDSDHDEVIFDVTINLH